MDQPVFDRREEHPEGPGLHALLVGVSGYPELPERDEQPTARQKKYGLGLSRLTAAACSAHLLYKWLTEARDRLAVPLVTCRLLLAPGERELAADAELGPLASDARLDTFLEAAAGWREDAAGHRDNVTLFYFAGHGLQRKRGDNVLILENFGDGIGSRLRNAVDTFSLLQGMAPSREYPKIARRQLYFLDSCRMRPAEAYRYEDMDCTAVWDTPVLEKDDRATPVFYTALPGTHAFAIPGGQTLFSKALLHCLSGHGSEAFEGRWAVTVDSLNEGLQYHLARVALEHEAEQDFRVDGLGKKVVLHYLENPPNVDVELEVSPGRSAADAKIVIDDLSEPRVIGPPVDPNPFKTSLRAGKYILEFRLGEAPAVRRLESLEPPHGRWPLNFP